MRTQTTWGRIRQGLTTGLSGPIANHRLPQFAHLGAGDDDRTVLWWCCCRSGTCKVSMNPYWSSPNGQGTTGGH